MAKKKEELEIKEEVKAEKKTPSYTHCYHCDRLLEGNAVAKGENNEFRFCGINCFNLDK